LVHRFPPTPQLVKKGCERGRTTGLFIEIGMQGRVEGGENNREGRESKAE